MNNETLFQLVENYTTTVTNNDRGTTFNFSIPLFN